MTAVRRAVAAATAALVASLWPVATALPAGAAETPRLIVDAASNVDGKIFLRFGATRSQSGRLDEPLGLSNDVNLTAAVPSGPPATLEAAVTSSSASGQRPRVMLVLDTSGSMLHPKSKFKAEKNAADAFFDKIGDGVDVGLVTFGSKVKSWSAPIPDKAKVRSYLSKLGTPKTDTSLFEAVTKAAKLMPPGGSPRFMFLVTDGQNDPTGEGLSASERKRQDRLRVAARSQLKRRADGIQFTGVLIDKSIKNDLPVIAPKGSVISADSADLDAAFSIGADKIKKLYTLQASVPPDLRGKPLNVVITARTETGEAVQPYPFTLPYSETGTAAGTPRAAAAIPDPVGARLTTPVIIAALAAFFLALCVLIMNATATITAGESKESEVSRRLAFYTLGGNRGKPALVTQENPRLTDSRFARSAINLVSRIARQRKLDNALDNRLEKAGLPVRTAEWTLLHLVIAIGSALLLLIAARGMILGAILGLLLGLAGPWLFLSVRTSLRERKFLAQLPDTLQLLAGSLASGYSLPQAMDSVLRESQAPISVEFNRALIETRLGMPPEDALDGIASRTASKDFSWVVMAIRIQREVGGNLAELLSTVAETLRERDRLRRQVSALSAEGRLSGIILGALPLVFALFLIFTKPDYISPLFQDPRGLILLAGGGLLLLAGGFWMSRLVKVEV